MGRDIARKIGKYTCVLLIWKHDYKNMHKVYTYNENVSNY